ncbi:Choline-phosphate cytidylyltransferase [Aphelenchoides fujianensis]|nr:Choline-phosphate cytidylyltransferase [Aphelenchoides fujianensis]
MPEFTPARALFSHEPAARRNLEAAGDDWKPRRLQEILESGQHLAGRVVRIYADGVFDLFHYGHAEQLRQVKELIPNSYLIAGVCGDADTRKYKAGVTVMNEKERAATVAHCRHVDEVITCPPFYPTLEFTDSLKVDLVAHDSLPYAIGEEIDDCYSPFKKADRFLETQRTPEISTTDLIQRIVGNFDAYRQRQVARLGAAAFPTV